MVENYRDNRLIKLENEMKERYHESVARNHPIERWKLEVMLEVARNNAFPCKPEIHLDGYWGDDERQFFSNLEALINEIAYCYAMSGA